jgi:phenylacetate-coenzyme A ligase PaaK-like adenylate-forming protein
LKNILNNSIIINLLNNIFTIHSEVEFNQLAIQVFYYQAINCKPYQEYIQHLGILPQHIVRIEDIPFIPIELFKSHKIISSSEKEEIVFTSSGTTGKNTSSHYVADIALYEKSFINCFERFYGPPSDYVIIGLLPSYLERGGSSLVYMVDKLIKLCNNEESGFYLNEYDILAKKLIDLDNKGQKTFLIGVSYALLDLIEKHSFKLKHCTILETGGMKGRRKEMIKTELHQNLTTGFGVENIHSEYGMTELLSQAYSQGDERFFSPPWMKILIRDPYDPFTLLGNNNSGGINIIDLANIFSCSFIETKDLGKTFNDGSFEILGRFDNSDIRGCNLLMES